MLLDKTNGNAFQRNINPLCEEELMQRATYCRLADIKKVYEDITVEYKNITLPITQLLYVDTRTHIVYSHYIPFNDDFGLFLDMDIIERKPANKSYNLCQFKPVGVNDFWREEDYKKFILDLLSL